MNNRLRELRAARRWSQADLADRLDVSRQTVNAIETGRYDPSLPLAFKIAGVFDDRMEALFFPTGPRRPPQDPPEWRRERRADRDALPQGGDLTVLLAGPSHRLRRAQSDGADYRGGGRRSTPRTRRRSWRPCVILECPCRHGWGGRGENLLGRVRRVIEVSGLAKSFGDVRAVGGVSFVVPDGVVTGFLGPNGSGKSTTMRLMLGLDHGGGVTTFDGRRLTDVESVTRTVGAHLDAKYFHPKRTARAHLRMLATEARVPDSRVDEVLEVFGLTSVSGKRPKGFSLGMGQRLGLAGAVLAEPRALMLDEPANGLDPQSIHWMRDFLKAYAERGNAVLVSSHLLSEMQLMADHVVVIAKGELVADGSMADLVASSARNDVLVRTRPADRQVLLEGLSAAGALARPEGSDAISVVGAEPAEVGLTAFSVGVPVLELTARRASLEQAFLELTEGQEQFRTGATGGAA